MKRVLTGLLMTVCVCVCATVAYAETQDSKAAATKPQPALGWHELGRMHVRDKAEKDLAFLHDGDDIIEVRLCAERNAIRLRNTELWMTGDKRQKLWLPLILEAGKCSDAIAVKDGPINVTHVALEYEALSLGAEGAHVTIQGKTKSHR